MRINKLELQAFGPFNKKETVLFSELYDSSIFLISGKTGSGKTTLFDAICFGLYGDTSADRDIRSLKSDFAVELETYVIIEFELDGIEYTIKRYPGDQRVRTEKGSKNLKNQEVILTYNDKTITNVTEAKNFIVDLLGVNAEQFKKIVMLPQGKFKELLFANTSEKGEIFRTIFGTERLSLITNNIKNKYNEVKKRYDETSRDKDKIISSFECEDNKTISEQIDSDTQFIAEVDLTINKYNEQIVLLRDEINKATDTNKKIADYNSAITQLAKLDSEKVEISNHRLKLEKTLLAKENRKLHNSILSLRNEITATTQEISGKTGDLENSVKRFEEIDVSDENIKRVRENIDIISSEFLEQKRVSEILNKIHKEKQNLDNKIAAQKELNQSILATNVSDEDIKKSMQNIKELDDELVQLKSLIVKINELREIENKLRDCLVKCQEFINKSKQSNDKLSELQSLYNKEMASQLAVELEEGMPCPVCGSKDHPNLAIPSGKEISKQMIEKQQKEKEFNTLELTKYETNRDTFTIEKEKKEQEIKDFGINYESNTEIDIYINDVNNRLVLEKETLVNVEKLLSEQNARCNLLSGLNSEIKVLENNFNKLNEELIVINKANLNYNTVKEALVKTSKNIEDEKTKLNNLEKLYKEKLTVKDSILKLKSQLNILQINLEKYNRDLNLEQEEFQNILEDNFEGNIDDFVNYLSMDSNSLKNIIDKYNNEITECKTTISNLDEFKNKNIIDINAQRNDLKFKETKISSEKLLRDKAYNRNILNTKNINTLNKLVLEMKDLEKKYLILERINNVAQGNCNSEKINFETHVLAVFYEEVLELTNNKLKQLSKGRYQLRRKMEKSGGGKQGLDTTIFDLTTGKERGISSVSGGESFMISLALALSLSEITQMNSNSVDIETLFIDEGFGTLDSEALEVTINLLLELNQDGKLIGIISHVKELQDRISAKLIIESTKKGSYIKEVIY